MFEIFQESQIQWNLFVSVILLILVLSFRYVGVRTVQSWDIPSADLRRRWLAQVRNFAFVFFLGGLLIIWGAEIRSLALSLAALAVAIVIATKELLLCLLGSFLKASTKYFKLGDRIEVSGFRGDVVEQNLFCTTLLEINASHHYTGRKVCLPNSVFLSSPVMNDSYGGKFGMHTFKVACERDEDWADWREQLLAAAKEETSEMVSEAQKVWNRVSRDKAIEAPNVDARVSLDFSQHDEIGLLVRVPCKPELKGRTEQAILLNFSKRIRAGANQTQ